jgi:hypothetical protein
MSRTYRRVILALAVILAVTSWSPAQGSAKASEIVKTDIDSRGRIHIIDSAGKEAVPPFDNDQVDCSSAKIAEDRHTVGWLAEYPNCCTSYPLPLALVIYRDGAILRQIAPGQSIWDWQFLRQGSRVAFWIGPTHGDFIPHFELHDARSGKLLAQWDGHVDQKHPAWVEGLKE